MIYKGEILDLDGKAVSPGGGNHRLGWLLLQGYSLQRCLGVLSSEGF